MHSVLKPTEIRGKGKGSYLAKKSHSNSQDPLAKNVEHSPSNLRTHLKKRKESVNEEDEVKVQKQTFLLFVAEKKVLENNNPKRSMTQSSKMP